MCLKKLAGGEQFFWDTLTNKNNFHNPIRMDLVRNPIVANAPATKRKKYKLVYDDGRPDVMVNQEAVERGKRMLEKDEAIDEARERLARAEKEVAEARAHLERLLREAEPAPAAPAPTAAAPEDMFYTEKEKLTRQLMAYLDVKRTRKEAIAHFNKFQDDLARLYEKYDRAYAGAVQEDADEIYHGEYMPKFEEMNASAPAPPAPKADDKTEYPLVSRDDFVKHYKLLTNKARAKVADRPLQDRLREAFESDGGGEDRVKRAFLQGLTYIYKKATQRGVGKGNDPMKLDWTEWNDDNVSGRDFLRDNTYRSQAAAQYFNIYNNDKMKNTTFGWRDSYGYFAGFPQLY